MKRIILGIAGSLHAGKSEARTFFEKLGIPGVDADSTVHRLYEPDAPGAKRIMDYFGPEFLEKDGRVNRRRLARMVFQNSHKLRILNKLIHPLVKHEVQKWIDQQENVAVTVEAAYFEKKGLLDLVTHMLVITRPNRRLESGYLKRLAGFSPEAPHADFTVENNSTKKEFHDKLREVWQEILRQSSDLKFTRRSP